MVVAARTSCGSRLWQMCSNCQSGNTVLSAAVPAPVCCAMLWFLDQTFWRALLLGYLGRVLQPLHQIMTCCQQWLYLVLCCAGCRWKLSQQLWVRRCRQQQCTARCLWGSTCSRTSHPCLRRYVRFQRRRNTSLALLSGQSSSACCWVSCDVNSGVSQVKQSSQAMRS